MSKDYINKSYGFRETVELEIKRSGYKYTGNINYVKLGKPLFDKLCKKWGSYSFKWYFTDKNNIKYFDGKEWSYTSLDEIVYHSA